MKQCIVNQCSNTNDPETGGEFEGDICAPCHRYIVAGLGNNSQAYRNAIETVLLRVKWLLSGDVASMTDVHIVNSQRYR